MQIFHFHPETGDYLGSSIADADPEEEGKWLIPAYAVESAPSVFDPATQTCRWNGADWVIAAIPAPAPNPAPTITDLKEAKLAEINSKCSDLLGAVKAGYPNDEVQSWSKQESEARAYAANNTAATPLLSAMSTARGIPLADLVSRVIVKADVFAETSGTIIGKRQRCEDQIIVATTADQVAAVTWPA